MNENRGQRTKAVLDKRRERLKRQDQQLEYDLTSLKFSDLAKANKAARKFSR